MALANRDELSSLPDGEYEIELEGRNLEFLIYTCSTGALRDQRIVKVRIGGIWKGFANLRVEDDNHEMFSGLYVWSSMRDRVEGPWVIGVSRAIRAFIFRVEHDGTAPDDFIIINNCPMVPSRIRANQRYAEEIRASEARETERRRRMAEEIARNAREEAASRNHLAMSYFHADVVR